MGDPNAIAYGSDSWNYFIQALYELMPSIDENEKRYLTSKYTTYMNTGSNGVITFAPPTLGQWNDIYGVSIDGIPSQSIDKDTFYKMKTNDLYSPANGESFYIFEADKMVILTGLYSATAQVEIFFLQDMQSTWGEATDSSVILINNSLIYKAIPLATNKLKEQIGLGM